MSIAQKVLADPGKYSIQQLRSAVEHGIIPAYIAIPIIQEKVQEAKQAQAAQAMQQPMGQPPVAQQVMAQARGLETLPTNLPTQYAHGGIVAFEEGGPVERYQNTGLVGVNPLVGGRLPGESFEDFKRRVLQADAQARQEAAAQENQAREAERQRLLAERGGPVIPNRPLMGNAPITAIQPNPATPVVPPTAADSGPATAADSGSTTTVPPSTGTGFGGNSALGRTPGQGFQPTGFPEPPKGTSMADFVTRQLYGNEMEPGFMSRSEARERTLMGELGKNRLQGKAFEGLESILKKEAEDAGVEKSDAKNMALFKAGLAMMAGTSRHALENIGKGAMTGAEDYQAAVKDLKKAEKERQRQFAYIEQARRAEDQDELKRRDNLLVKANESAQKRDEFGVNAIVNATGKDRDQATEIWKTQYGGEKSVQVAQIGAGATLGAAALRANAREGITPYQMARLRQEAEKQIDPNAIRAQLVQQLKLSKAPKPGADPTFEQRYQQAYAAAIEDRISRNLGYGFGGAGAGGTGFKVPQGYRLLGPEE